MNTFSIRPFELPSSSIRPSKILAIYLLRPDISEDSFDGALSQVLTTGNQFDAVHFVGFNDCLNQVKTWQKANSSIFGRLSLSTVNLSHSTRVISFNENTGKHTIECLDGHSIQEPESEINSHKRHSLTNLFILNNGHMETHRGFHYVKPSQKHVGKFLRTANVLEQSEAAYIIAFWTMSEIWGKNISQIYVDTSGISDIALTLAYEAFFRQGVAKLPIISSHRSYDGLTQLIINRPNETLILTSATTSGGLKNKLIERGASKELIFTLFYLGETPQEVGNILCDLTKRPNENTLGIEPIENFSATNCPYCQKKSYPVSLEGDQFAFEPPKVEEITIALSDLTESKQKLFDQLAGIDFFKVYRNINDRSLEFFLDANSLFSTQATAHRPTLDLLENVGQRWKNIVLRGSPVNLKRIIYADTPLSSDLANSAWANIKTHQSTSNNVLVSSKEFRSTSSSTHGAAALVVTSCIDDSHELMAINRDLRAHHPQGNTTYISPIFRAKSSAERARIKSNLTFGENGPSTFSLYSLIDIDLPDDDKSHSWATELKTLRSMEYWADLAELEIPSLITKRIDFLEKEAPTTGISENLFWPDIKNIPLRVRSDFTLLNTLGGTRHLSQADIFAVVSAVIHSLRGGISGKAKLAYKQYERAVLSPENFYRFNDGVIQASLLRASRGYEFAYANCDERISSRMKSYILSDIENLNSGGGEAFSEILLSIACGRMTFHNEHLSEILNAINCNSSLPPHIHFFAKYIADNNIN
ncbi:MAG: hypothetical protein KJ850_11405 [Gammaproteobacteria bacterium]|nr:hypothetical protein [Gammaproteobacteria bacterium]MBU1625636.1 hypothetical protein [Gammaproteobacteria bacterium]MBU1980896.1 hypothetical protein [Gammaproteobacteria bacterium]